MLKIKRIKSSINELIVNLDRIGYFLSRVSYPTIDLYNKTLYKRKRNRDFPEYVGLSLSRLCGANCIFCPITRTQKQVKKKAFMDLKIVDKIIEELSVRKFEGTLSLGENGDALINPRFKEIVERIHENLNCNVILFTNMMQIDRELSKFLLDKGLSLLHLNIDGNCRETYEYSKKGCKYDVVTRNLHDFIKLRDETGKNCALAIKVLPPKRYMKYIEGKDVDIPYDAKETVEYWKPFLSKDDSISEHITFSRWALQSEIPRGLPCPNTRQLFECCYINTEGEAYFCCVDYLTEMTYGNVMETSIYEAWNGKKRKETLKAIVGKDFQRTGKPCSICPEKNDYIRSYLHYLTYKG